MSRTKESRRRRERRAAAPASLRAGGESPLPAIHCCRVIVIKNGKYVQPGAERGAR